MGSNLQHNGSSIFYDFILHYGRIYGSVEILFYQIQNLKLALDEWRPKVGQSNTNIAKLEKKEEKKNYKCQFPRVALYIYYT
jgi:hypothetical protein